MCMYKYKKDTNVFNLYFNSEHFLIFNLKFKFNQTS